MLVGTVEPTPWDIARLRERVETVPGVSDDLLGIGSGSRSRSSRAFILDGDDLSRMLAGVQGLHSDNQPVIEYLTPRAGSRHDPDQRRRRAGSADQGAPAIAGFDEARDLDARAQYLLGLRYASLGRTIRRSDDGAERRGPSPEAKFLVGLGNQYRAKGWNGKAIAIYRRALERDPADAEASLQLAELLRAQGDEAGAEKELREALERVKDDPALALAAARLLVETGRAAEACRRPPALARNR